MCLCCAVAGGLLPSTHHQPPASSDPLCSAHGFVFDQAAFILSHRRKDKVAAFLQQFRNSQVGRLPRPRAADCACLAWLARVAIVCSAADSRLCPGLDGACCACLRRRHGALAPLAALACRCWRCSSLSG